MSKFNLQKIITQPQTIPKEFYEYFGVISQLEFPNYYEFLVSYSGNQKELKYLLRILGIKFYFINQISNPKKHPNQTTSYRKTSPLNYTKIELLKLKACKLIN